MGVSSFQDLVMVITVVVVVVYFSDMFHLIQYRNKHANIGTQPSLGL